MYENKYKLTVHCISIEFNNLLHFKKPHFIINLETLHFLTFLSTFVVLHISSVNNNINFSAYRNSSDMAPAAILQFKKKINTQWYVSII